MSHIVYRISFYRMAYIVYIIYLEFLKPFIRIVVAKMNIQCEHHFKLSIKSFCNTVQGMPASVESAVKHVSNTESIQCFYTFNKEPKFVCSHGKRASTHFATLGKCVESVDRVEFLTLN